MDQNNNKKPGGGKNSNLRGFLQLICWAVLLAVLVNYEIGRASCRERVFILV